MRKIKTRVRRIVEPSLGLGLGKNAYRTFNLRLAREDSIRLNARQKYIHTPLQSVTFFFSFRSCIDI